MPGYRAHLFGGLAAAGIGLWVAQRLGFLLADVQDAAFLAGTAAAAALFPDVDTDSKGQRWFYVALAAGDIWLIQQRRYTWAALLGLLAMLPAIGRHRGWTHTWWAAIVVPFVIFGLPAYVLRLPMRELAPFYCAAVTGYISHLMLDRTW